MENQEQKLKISNASINKIEKVELPTEEAYKIMNNFWKSKSKNMIEEK